MAATATTSGKGKAAEKPLASLLAGATAGGIESFITFPLESLKTQLQFGALKGQKVGHPSILSGAGYNDYLESVRNRAERRIIGTAMGSDGETGCARLTCSNLV
jgi:hypothetical protein